MDNKELDKSRAEFEAWGRANCGMDGESLARRDNGHYDWGRTCDMFEAWCAARAGSAAPAGQQAEPVAIMQRFPDDQPASQAYTPVRPAWLGSMPPVGTKLYTAPVSAAPTAAEGPTLRDADQEARYAFDVRFKNDSHVGWKPLDYWQGGYSAALARTAAPVCPSGYRLVPIVPTENMVVAFAETWFSKVRCIDDHDMTDAYAAMLAAAPLPTKEGAEEVDAAKILSHLKLPEPTGHVSMCEGRYRIPAWSEVKIREAVLAAIAAQPKDTTDTKEKGDA